MANQITIDIVAETKKLTSGIDDANKQLGGMSKQLKAAAGAAAGLASAFVLKKGISFLKEGIGEAKDAASAMRGATAAFGEGSAALQKITKDAEKFGKEISVDNDELIVLATQLGSRLPKAIQGSSVELVKIFKDVEAFTGGAVSAEGAGNKLAKAFADGELKAKELQKIFPSLNASVYEQAEALSAAGKNQEAINLLTEEGAKKYGDAAAKNVDATQKFNVALDNFKETLGTKVLPILEKGITFLNNMLDAFSTLPAPMQNVIIAFGGIVAIGGPLLGFLASAKTSLEVLGVAKGLAAVQTNLFSVALKAIPILAIIALIVLLIQNWDDVSATAKKTWEAVSKWFGKVYDDIKEFLGDAIDWVKENWPKLLAILTGPFGLLIAFFVTYKDDIVKKIGEIWEAVKTETVKWLDQIVAAVIEVWDAITGFILAAVKLIRDGIVNRWNTIVKDVQEVFNALKTSVKTIWDNIVTGAADFVDRVIEKFKDVFGLMIKVGKDIARGVWEGLNSMKDFLKGKFNSFFGDLLPGWARAALKISSPSKVFAEVGENIIKGLAGGITSGVNVSSPRVLSPGINSMSTPFNVTINAGLGTDPYELGRVVSGALKKYGSVSGK